MAQSKPARGFPIEEFEARTERAQTFMAEMKIDALWVCTEPDMAYFSGYNSYFWQSPTRPWFLVVPSTGKPIALVPSLGEAAVRRTWLDEVRVWASPNPEDEGIGLLTRTLKECATHHGRVGAPLGPETHLRLPANDVARLRADLGATEIVDATRIVSELRQIKSPLEIEKHAYICGCVSSTYEAMPSLIRSGMSEWEAFQKVRINLIEQGVDSAPFLTTITGPGGVDDAIRLPTDRLIEPGDLVFIDTGSEFDNYYSDFDRNFAFVSATDEARYAYALCHKALDAGIAAAHPGARTYDVWQAMASVLAESGTSASAIGRMGHGVGLRNTEWPSIMETDTTLIREGMILAIEPGYEFGPGKLMLHEENVVIRSDGAELLSRRAAPELPILD